MMSLPYKDVDRTALRLPNQGRGAGCIRQRVVQCLIAVGTGEEGDEYRARLLYEEMVEKPPPGTMNAIEGQM
jgi:hypothetical protein